MPEGSIESITPLGEHNSEGLKLISVSKGEILIPVTHSVDFSEVRVSFARDTEYNSLRKGNGFSPTTTTLWKLRHEIIASFATGPQIFLMTTLIFH